MDILDTVLMILSFAIPVILAVALHEAAHGFVALWFGDDTAKRMGRLTLNPFKHIDPIGTVLLPAALILMRAPFVFGYAKPVPVQFQNLKNPKRDMIWVAAAGPAMNILLGIISAVLFGFFISYVGVDPSLITPNGLELNLTRHEHLILQGLTFSMQINALLAVFNMIPLPPLDGGRVAVGLLPNKLAIPLSRLEPYGFIILIALIFIIPYVSAALGFPINLFQSIILPPTQALIDFMIYFSGY
jgi:Zn-dependent protease